VLGIAALCVVQVRHVIVSIL